MKKTKIYQTKTFTVTIVQENHILITIMSLENNHSRDITIVEDLQIKEIHVISHKIDIIDQTVKTINIEIIIQDQTQTEATTQIIAGIVQTQTPKIYIIQTTVLETPHTIETETIQTTGTDSIKITDHETIQTIDQDLIIITIDDVTILKIEIQFGQIDKEIFLNHHTETIHNIRILNKTIEVVHLNIKDKLTKYNPLKKLNQTLSVLITQKPKNYASIT